MSSPQPAARGGLSEVEIISQQGDEETKSIAAGQLASFAYRDLPLAPVDLSAAGSQLLSNLDEDYQREGSTWLRPCCGKRAAVWQVFLLSASLNSVLVACVILVVTLLTLELLIDIKLLQCEYCWSRFRVFDGAVIVLSLAPMVASTVANGPRSPWDAISLIILLRIWRVKRVIDAYVLPVKVELELVIQQYEKAKVIQDEQLERLTQICQEQGVTVGTGVCSEQVIIVTPRYRHLGGRQGAGAPAPASRLVVDARGPETMLMADGSLGLGPEAAAPSVGQKQQERALPGLGERLALAPSREPPTRHNSLRCLDCSGSPLWDVKLSSLWEDPCPSQGAWDPAPFAQPSPASSPQTSLELAHRVSLLNRRNQEGFPVLQLKPALHFQAPTLHPFSSLESKEQALHRVPEA
ncbi:PREDICTED: transmembrane protein 266 [Myotis davidii]|uniref:transmembrane protein 266 n=1 Tax=Myotis davidii TaxID=225400 RepID=UPI00076750F9|nr:PREDICTED: transmembrane protein 266 [Myotis davidii]